MMFRPAILVLIAVSLFVPSVRLAAAGRNGAPKLLSTTGAAPRWKDDVEMKRMAEAGDAEACLEMGILQENGGEEPPDYIAARLWYEKAASKGMVVAEFRLGKLVSEGLGGSANQEAAFRHYLKAAEAGMALAQYNVGAMLASGRGARRDYVEGLAWIVVASRDPEVGSEGERLLRERLARRPADIAAAEKRAEVLAAMLAERSVKAAAAKAAEPARR